MAIPLTTIRFEEGVSSMGVDGEYRFFGSSGIRGWIANSWDDLAPDDGTGAGFASLSLRSNLYQASVTHFGNYWNGTWLQYGLQGNWKTGSSIQPSSA